MKRDAYWIAAWILPKKKIQWSHKKEAWFDEKGKQLPSFQVEKHKPERKDPIKNNEINDLKKKI